MKKRSGFSLLELLIVVAIILIIAAIAIPNLLRARIAANEASAVGSVRTINTAEIAYLSIYPTVGYASTLTTLGPAVGSPCVASSASACLIDSRLATGTKSGYSIGIANTSGTPTNRYDVIASPAARNQTGTRYFCSLEDAVVRYSTGTIASCTGTITALQ
ncbi:MAG TPA: prepilin-type N-terminal cleavage/methylation domain-containing protein [Terriglobales bacterium]|jgi:prepilin-type N-terminal cleavage/methylation domain-containing protein